MHLYDLKVQYLAMQSKMKINTTMHSSVGGKKINSSNLSPVTHSKIEKSYC